MDSDLHAVLDLSRPYLLTGAHPTTARPDPLLDRVDCAVTRVPQAGVPVLEALSSVYRSDFVGVCEVLEDRAVVARLYLLGGQVVHVALPDHTEALGHVLYELQLIDRATYAETMRQAKQEGKLHGQVLLELQLIDELRLNYALSLQLHRKLRRIFSQRESRYDLRPDAHLYGGDDALRKMLPPSRQVIYLAARMSHADDLVAVIRHTAGRPLFIRPERAGEIAQYGFGAKAAEAARRLVESPVLARELMEPEATRFEVGAALATLLLTDLCELGPAVSRRSLPNRQGAPMALQLASADSEYAAYEIIRSRPALGAASATPVSTEPPDPVRDATADELRCRLDALERQSHFEVLGVSKEASTEQVRAAFLQLVRRFHPDRITALGLKYLTVEADRFCQRLSEAKMTLSDPMARARYLALLDDRSAGEIIKRKLAAERHYQRGEQLLGRGDLQAAHDEFERAFANNTEEADFRAALAWCRFLTERSDPDGGRTPAEEAKRMLWGTIKRWPNRLRSYLYLSRVLVAGGEQELAIACLRKAAATESMDNDHEIMSELRLLERRQRAAAERARRARWLPVRRPGVPS